MRWIALLLLMPLLLRAADEEAAWSKPVQGVRARLYILPGHDPDLDYRYQVYLQFENVGVTGNLGLIREAKSFQYSGMDLALQVVDARNRKVAATSPAMFDGMVPVWNLLVPPGGSLSFPIGFVSSDWSLSITPFQAWNLASTGPVVPHYLSGTFTAKFPRPNPPRNLDVRLNWEGPLELPPIEIPAR